MIKRLALIVLVAGMPLGYVPRVDRIYLCYRDAANFVAIKRSTVVRMGECEQADGKGWWI